MLVTGSLLMALWLGQLSPAESDPAVGALRMQLASMVDASGAAREGRTDRLDALATRAGQLAESSRDGEVMLAARLVAAQAYHAIALHDIAAGRASLASLRLVQVRSAANAAGRVDAAGARLAGDYWLLVADLVDARRNARSPAEAQLGAIAQLERFLSIHGEAADSENSDVVRTVRKALMRLCDQAGENQRAVELMQQLRRVTPDGDPLEAAFIQVVQNAALVGQFLAPGVVSGSSDTWRLLIVHDEASAEPARDAAAQVERERAGEAPALEVVILPAKQGELSDARPQGLSDLSPRFVLVDPSGVVRSVGHTAAVASRLGAFLPPVSGKEENRPIE